jgi:hypothetical protein
MTNEADAKNAARKRTPTPKPSEFAISLAACIQTVTGTHLLCDHQEEGQVGNGEKSDYNQTDPIHVTFGFTFVTLSFADPYVYG